MDYMMKNKFWKRCEKRCQLRGASQLKFLPITYYLLPITHYLLPITYYPLPITHYLLPITHYLLPKKYLLPRNYILPKNYLSLPKMLEGGKMPLCLKGLIILFLIVKIYAFFRENEPFLKYKIHFKSIN